MNLILPKIITGGSLESLFYAYIHETPIVLTQPYVPFELDMVEDNTFFELQFRYGTGLCLCFQWPALS
jgi:hypothetical protein